MLNTKIITLERLSGFGSTANLNEQVKTLVEQQKSVWKIAADNYNVLNRIQTNSFDFGHFKILTQFNAERIRSSAAKTDTKSIAKRRCFLCIENLPEVQKGIIFQDKFLILVNPYPIFQQHFTISHLKHIPQNIENDFADLLDLSYCLPDFTVFYNGPQCGASAPDHLHFQAVIKNSLPIETEFDVLENQISEVIVQNKKSKVIAVQNYLRRFIAIVSNDKNEIIKSFNLIYKNLETRKNEEPMLNVLCNFQDGKWRVTIFPREKQRSSHFYRTEDDQILVSPAAVELGGVMVLPREEDFRKITINDIEEIYGEVTIQKEKFEKLIRDVRLQME